ncbi:MAG: hypothetical protein J0L84_07995 [Verrucomicrobia bacterium]|nr:hypothetical protein [Verrucomicrobiota bacterium]
MPGELKELEFLLDDEIGGRPLTPGTVDLPTLRGFLEEVEKLIKGDVAGASLGDSRVRLEEGSVKLVALVAHLLAEDVRSDLARLEETGDLDAIQPRRAEVIEQWQARTRRFPSRAYSIQTGFGHRPLRVSSSSQFQHGNENDWVGVEKYLTGKVVNAGGKQDPNVHLVLADTGGTIRISATEQQLGAEKENQLYKDVTLRVQAEQHVRTKALREVRLIQFLAQASEADERALAHLWQRGREAWRDVASPARWVESLRGNK